MIPPKISLSNFKSNYILESRSQNVNKTRLKHFNIDFYRGKKLMFKDLLESNLYNS